MLDSTGWVAVTYQHGLKVMQVDGAASPSCDAVPTVANSDKALPGTSPRFLGDTVTYVCDVGFTAAGSNQVSTCQSDGTWSTVVACINGPSCTLSAFPLARVCVKLRQSVRLFLCLCVQMWRRALIFVSSATILKPWPSISGAKRDSLEQPLYLRIQLCLKCV